jgi:hypothetical protein
MSRVIRMLSMLPHALAGVQAGRDLLIRVGAPARRDPGKVRWPRDQPKLLLQSEGRAKVCAGHQIELDHMAGVNFDLSVVVKSAA